MKEKLRAVSSKLPESVIKRWHLFAVQNSMSKPEALATIITKGTKK